MLTPNNESGDKLDKVMLLATWANTLSAEGKSEMIFAGMGKPTYPVNVHTIESFIGYYQGHLSILARSAQSSEQDRAKAAINYGDPRGMPSAKTTMAEAMTRWYGTPIKPENILFTVGGAGALRVIFETMNELNKDTPGYRVITPFPHYTLYSDNSHTLHPVEVLNESGYRLTANALRNSIEKANLLAETDKKAPKYILLCNPNNPLGTVISEGEWTDIISVLKEYPDLKIVIDEAYAEMDWSDTKSLLTMAPELKERVILLRSATKAHSAAGARLAMLMAFDSQLMNELIAKNVGMIGHAPLASQKAYADTMKLFDENNVQTLKKFYKPKVDYVAGRLEDMGALLPDPNYRSDGTFYAMADLSDIFGTEIPEAAERALGRTGKIQTSEELTYSFLFDKQLMIAPGQYFGLPENLGFMRITCSDEPEKLEDMMGRIESYLLDARAEKYNRLINTINNRLSELKTESSEQYLYYQSQLMEIQKQPLTCKSYIEINKQCRQLASEVSIAVIDAVIESSKRGEPEALDTARQYKKSATVLQSFFKEKIQHRKDEEVNTRSLDAAWIKMVNEHFEDGPTKIKYLNYSAAERLEFKPWKSYLMSQSTIEAASSSVSPPKP